jgi:hypothetical protein
MGLMHKQRLYENPMFFRNLQLDWLRTFAAAGRLLGGPQDIDAQVALMQATWRHSKRMARQSYQL